MTKKNAQNLIFRQKKKPLNVKKEKYKKKTVKTNVPNFLSRLEK
jgi:hypothetical protein